MAMTLEEIQTRIDALGVCMVAKGLRSPEPEYRVRANMDGNVHISWVKSDVSYAWDRHYKVFDTLDAADAFVEAMPDRKQRETADFMAKLGDVIDLGRKIDIDVSYVNPLVETMKRLSENVITHQAAE